MSQVNVTFLRDTFRAMTDEERVERIRTYVAEIERIKNAHSKGGKEHESDIEKILFRLRVIWKLHQELQRNDREDMWEEFREWAERLEIGQP